MMALTFRWARACRERRQAGLLLAVGALGGLVIGVAVVVVFPDSHAHALNAAGAFQRDADHRGAELRRKAARAASCGWAARRWVS